MNFNKRPYDRVDAATTDSIRAASPAAWGLTSVVRHVSFGRSHYSSDRIILMRLRSYPLGARLIVIIVLPVLAGAAWLCFTLAASLPAEGVLRLTHGVSTPVTVVRDANGVAHIRAGSDVDAFFAVGYVHAQDRLWQLELQRRTVRGRLSEVFGKDTIDSDVWFRTLGLYESTKSAWLALSPDARRSLTAYTAGINAWIAEKHKLPAEFRMFGFAPTPWTELDSLAWIKMFALDLGGNFRREIDRYIAKQSLTESQLLAFFPSYPKDAPTTAATTTVGHNARDLVALAEFHRRLERDFKLGAPNVGSNAWVVSGRLTRDGSALLANDPHLSLRIPSPWYAISIDAPTLNVSGMNLVGLPLVIFGRNARIAWGGTNMMADTQDLFFELPDRTGARYKANDRWPAFETRTETIRVRANFPHQLREQYKPITLKIRSTRNGPVISDYFGVFDQPVTLHWTALDPGDTSYEAFFRLNYAHDWSSFKIALSYHVAPAMNMVYADRQGNIGYLGAGRIPIRKTGEGTIPSTGWNDAYSWTGQVPVVQWPHSYNPSSGYIVSANNRVANDSYPYFISHDWASPARARRIEQLLQAQISAGKPLTAADMRRIQTDTLDLEAAALMADLRKRLPTGEHGAQAAAYLKSWDGNMHADSQAAAIFHVWMLHFRRTVFADQLRGSWNNREARHILRGLARNVDLEYLRGLLRHDELSWCDDNTTPEWETCDDALASSLESALWELYKLRGDWSMASWRWGEVQTTVYEHMPFSDLKPFNKLFERRVSSGGGSQNTINVAGSSFAGADGYVQTFGASFRQIISLGDDHACHYFMNSTGQSGNVMSSHYDDMIAPFREVQYRMLDSTYDHTPCAAAPQAVAVRTQYAAKPEP